MTSQTKYIKKALIVVDIQNDFCQNGPLPVPNASQIFPIINQIKKDAKFDLIVLTRDMHPKNHVSFSSRHNIQSKQIFINNEKQQLWPDHCVINTFGAEISNLYEFSGTQIEVHKGTSSEEDAYSGFGKSKYPTKLKDILLQHNIKSVVVTGLALDFCVGKTALDAKNFGFDVIVIAQATKGIFKATIDSVLKEFSRNGIKYVNYEQALKLIK